MAVDRNSLSLFNSAYEDFPASDGAEWSIEQHNADVSAASRVFVVSWAPVVRRCLSAPPSGARALALPPPSRSTP